MSLWEILVPKFWNDGTEIEIDHHKKWDEEALLISAGMTILRTAKGVWNNQKNLVSEGMIPVRLLCGWNEIHQLANFTREHYQQNVIMFYKISDEVHFV